MTFECTKAPMESIKRASTSLGEVTLIVAIFAGWFIAGSVQAVLLGFPAVSVSDQQALGIVLIECISFSIAFVVLRARGWKLHDFSLEINWRLTFAGATLAVIAIVTSLLIWQLFGRAVGGQEFLRQFEDAIAVSLPVAVLLSVINGAYEEFFLCRYVIDGLARFGVSIALGISALIRVTYHLYQGPMGAILVLGFALVVTVYYWRTRALWPVILAHILLDLIALS